MDIVFDNQATASGTVKRLVDQFLNSVNPLEKEHGQAVIVFQDGVQGAYNIKCSLSAVDANALCDLNAKLEVDNPESYRANRELLKQHNTFAKMKLDAARGREFNDIIVEYNTSYAPDTPLKVWGGQHRISAIKSACTKANRFHGFRIYFALTKEQRTEIALISNTNISVSNDTFDRMLEETMFGNTLRQWCQRCGLLKNDEDFPDIGSRSEKITVKKARSFIVNFYLGKCQGEKIPAEQLDQKVYEPYLPGTGVAVDDEYENVMKTIDILTDDKLLLAGKRFAALHNAQYKAVTDKKDKVKNSKANRNKAFVESVLCGWSFVAGLLQCHTVRLENHYRIPKVGKIPDPLNATEMSKFKHDQDPPTYRGLGTRSSVQDRQRIAQLFLAKSLEENVVIDNKMMNKAVSQVVGIKALSKGYK